ARADQNQSLIFLQAFMGVAAVTSLALAAAVLDGQRAQKTIQKTEQRLRMVAEESARIREEFLSIATHELRTPVAALRGYIQLGQQSLDRGQHDRLRDTLKVALRQTDRLTTLIAQLLDASQMQAGRLKIERTPTDISTLVSSAVEAERLASEPRPWVVQVEPRLRASIDAVRFEQVVVNLLDNAVKFSPSGGTLTVDSAARVGSSGLRWETRVSVSLPTGRRASSNGSTAHTTIAASAASVSASTSANRSSSCTVGGSRSAPSLGAGRRSPSRSRDCQHRR